MLNELIDSLVETPTEEKKDEYLLFVNQQEYSLLESAEKYPIKSMEYFKTRTQAFSYRRESAQKLITKWVAKYGTTDGCAVSYADTLNIPFQQIKKPSR
jgi:ABC-type nitrate/sulfonate/bicarbonate transport system substrate-binding protein